MPDEAIELESGNVGGGTHGYTMYKRPNGSIYMDYYIDEGEATGTADKVDELSRVVQEYLGENFYNDQHPYFCKFWDKKELPPDVQQALDTE